MIRYFSKKNRDLAIWAQPALAKRPREPRQSQAHSRAETRCQQPCRRRDGANGAGEQLTGCAATSGQRDELADERTGSYRNGRRSRRLPVPALSTDEFASKIVGNDPTNVSSLFDHAATRVTTGLAVHSEEMVDQSNK